MSRMQKSRNPDPESAVHQWLGDHGAEADPASVVAVVQNMARLSKYTSEVIREEARAHNLVVGARAWEAKTVGLGSLAIDHIYPRGVAPPAGYLGYRDTDNPQHVPSKAVVLDQNLGYFAFKEIQDAMRRAEGDFFGIFGYIAMWGEIAEHENGYRSEYAYPLSIVHMSNEMPPVGRTKEFYAELYGIHQERRDRDGYWKAVEREACGPRNRSPSRNLTHSTGAFTARPRADTGSSEGT